MVLNPFYVNIIIDSCAFDPKYQPESICAEGIFKLYEQEEINLIVAHSTMKEIEHPNTPTKVKAAAPGMVYTLKTNLTAGEILIKKTILDLLTGNGNPKKMEQDANHIFEAHKYGGYFVTTDERIISKRNGLKDICNAQIVKPCELVAIIKEYENC